MIKSNSKKATENLKKYIISIYNTDIDRADLVAVSDGAGLEDFPAVAKNIYICFSDEMIHGYNKRRNEQEVFSEWCSGLPGVLHTYDYYLKSAVEVLGDILEETAEERAKFDRSQAEKMLNYLIYREIKKAR